MKCILNVGATKTGKTTATKELLSNFNNSNLYIYDVNNEYRDFYKGSFLKFDEFLNKVKSLKNSIIVFEEATIFFTHKNCNQIITDMIVRKRHTNNIIILNFHSMRKVPMYIFDLTDYIILRKTNDNQSFISSKFGEGNILNSFVSVQENESRYYSETIDLYE
jgi:hypothetical protein